MNSGIFKSIMGTLDMCPYVPRSKGVISEGAALLAGAGVNFLGNLLGFGSSQSANSTNLEIARMNNEQAYKMFKEQNAFNLDMWNKNNAYNDPSKNVERLLRAGINPAAVYGSGSTVPASQIQSATAPQLQRAEVRPFMPDFDGVGQAVNAYFDNQMKSKAAESTGIDNQMKSIDLQYKAMHHISDLMEKKARIDNYIADSNLKGEQLNYYKNLSEEIGLNIRKFKDTYQELVEREKIQNDVMRAQEQDLLSSANLKRVQSDFQNLVIAYYPSMTQAELGVLSAQFTDIVKSAELKVKEGKLTDAKTVSQFIQNSLDDLEFKKQKNVSGENYGKFARRLKRACDYVGGLLFSNLKLFGRK